LRTCDCWGTANLNVLGRPTYCFFSGSSAGEFHGLRRSLVGQTDARLITIGELDASRLKRLLYPAARQARR
jgi:hypothetical protein